MAAVQQNSDKQLTYKCKDVVWCQSMDLMCVIGQEGIFEVHRLVNQHQKVFSKEDKLSPIISAFHQDGRFFVIAYENGRVAILPSDSGELILSLDLHNFPVNGLLWQNFNSTKIRSVPYKSSESYVESQLALKNKAAFLKTNFISTIEKLSLMISSDLEGNLIFSAFGIFPIAKIQLPTLAGGFNLSKIITSPDFSRITAICDNAPHNTNDTNAIFDIDCFLISNRAAEIEVSLLNCNKKRILVE